MFARLRREAAESLYFEVHEQPDRMRESKRAGNKGVVPVSALRPSAVPATFTLEGLTHMRVES